MLKFKYDHNNHGVEISGIEGDKRIYIGSESIEHFLKCIMVDRVVENWKNTKSCAEAMAAFTHAKVCDKCKGYGITGIIGEIAKMDSGE